MRAAFVVLATQRSGSTWLVDALNRHPEVHCYSELFLEGGPERPSWGARDLELFERFAAPGGDRAEALAAYLDLVLRRRPGVRAAGFKLMYGQAGAHPGLLPELARRHARAVHLVRRNHLDVVVSREVAWRRDVFHTTTEARGDLPRINLEPRSLVSRLEALAGDVVRGREMLRAAGLEAREFGYEDLTAAPDRLRDVLAFLGVDPDVAVASPLRKIVTAAHREVIGNFDEVAAVLAATPFEGCLRGRSGRRDP